MSEIDCLDETDIVFWKKGHFVSFCFENLKPKGSSMGFVFPRFLVLVASGRVFLRLKGGFQGLDMIWFNILFWLYVCMYVCVPYFFSL